MIHCSPSPLTPGGGGREGNKNKNEQNLKMSIICYKCPKMYLNMKIVFDQKIIRLVEKNESLNNALLIIIPLMLEVYYATNLSLNKDQNAYFST